MTQFYNENNMARRPGLLAANACFLLAGAGLVLLDALAVPIFMFIYGLFGPIGDTAALFWADAAYYLPCVLLPGILLSKRYGARSMRLEPVPPGMGLMSVLTAALCVPMVNAVAVIWSVMLESMGIPLTETEIVMENTGDLVMGVFAMGVMPGICEELMFRGVVLRGYERYGSRKAIIISSLLFASLHGSVQGFPGQLLMGLVLGLVVCKSGSIYAGMMLHTTYNSILIMLAYVQSHLPDAEVIGTTMLERIGGAQGLALMAAECTVMFVIMRAIMRYFRRNAVPDSAFGPFNGAPGMGVCETLILVSGVVTVIYLYINDIMNMLGYA